MFYMKSIFYVICDPLFLLLCLWSSSWRKCESGGGISVHSWFQTDYSKAEVSRQQRNLSLHLVALQWLCPSLWVSSGFPHSAHPASHCLRWPKTIPYPHYPQPWRVWVLPLQGQGQLRWLWALGGECSWAGPSHRWKTRTKRGVKLVE